MIRMHNIMIYASTSNIFSITEHNLEILSENYFLLRAPHIWNDNFGCGASRTNGICDSYMHTKFRTSRLYVLYVHGGFSLELQIFVAKMRMFT